MKMKVPTILIIESQASVRIVLAEVLEEAGYQVCEAANGRQGLEQIHVQPVDLVILNPVMSEMNGLELILEVTCAFLDIRVIPLSGRFVEELQTIRLIGAHQNLTNSQSLHPVMLTVQHELQQELHQ
ncbi:MAG: response regulator [Nitrospira sp.]